MKRTSKILIFGGAAFFIGVVLWIAGMSVIGWDFKRLDSTEYTARSFVCENSVDGINVDLASFPLTVKTGDAVSLDYYEADNSEVFVEEKDGKLTVTEKYSYNPFKSGMFNIGRLSHKFTLTVVSGVTFEINGVNSDVSFEGGEFGSITMDINNADVNISGAQFDAIDMNIDNGDIELKSCTANKIDIGGKNTSLELNGVSCDSLSVHTVNADIELSGCNIKDLSVDVTNLRIGLGGDTIGTALIDATNADCELKRMTVDRLKIDATNLDAEIEIVGVGSEYTVMTEGSGMPSDRAGSTEKTIELSGTNNDVTLEFVTN